MGLVHDDGTVLVQVWFAEGLAQQNAVCHVFDDCRLREGREWERECRLREGREWGRGV